MAAATAIWKDLRAHRILPALLNRPDGESDDEANPEYDIGAGVFVTDCIWSLSFSDSMLMEKHICVLQHCVSALYGFLPSV